MSDYVCYPITGLDKPLVIQEVEVLTISRQSAHEGDNVISPTHSRLYPQVTSLALIFVRFVLANFRLEIQCFTQIRHTVPHLTNIYEAL